MKKSLVALSLVALVLAPTGARAGGVVYVAGDLPQMIKEYVGDTLINAAVNAAIGSITSSVTKWANTGFKGKPAFVTDLKKTMNSLEGTAVSGLLNSIENAIILGDGTNPDLDGFFCGPFDREIRDALRIQLAVSTAKVPFTERSKCTLDSILEKGGNTMKDFESDFSKGGWPAWLELTKPRNNRWGAISLTYREIWRQGDEAKEEKTVEIASGRGFLSQFKPRECKLNPNGQSTGTGTHGTGEGKGPNGWPLNTTTGVEECPEDFQKTPDTWVTPGSVVENKINSALGLSDNRLVAADEINEMLGALITGLIRKAFEGGGGLLGLSDSSKGSSYLSQVAAEGNARRDALSAKALAQAGSAIEDGKTTSNLVKQIEAKEAQRDACYAELSAIKGNVNINISVRGEGGFDASAETGRDEEAYQAKKAECDALRAEVERLQARLQEITVGNIAKNTQSGISSGGADDLLCQAKLSGLPANNALSYRIAGPIYGEDKEVIYGIPGLEPGRYYKNARIEMDMYMPSGGTNKIPLIWGTTDRVYVGTGGRFLFESRGVSTFLDGPGGPKSGSTNWVEGKNYHLSFLYSASSGNLEGTISNKDDGGIAGAWVINKPFAVKDIGIPQGGMAFILSSPGFVFSNITLDMESGGPYSGGIAKKCEPGDEPYSGE